MSCGTYPSFDPSSNVVLELSTLSLDAEIILLFADEERSYSRSVINLFYHLGRLLCNTNDL